MAVRPIDAGVLQDNLTDIYGDGNRLVYLKDVLGLIDEQPTLTPPNEPLTLEQLREMDGEPVWIERNEAPHDGKWFIVDHADIENPDRTLYTKEGVTYSDYGVHFTAYAYPPAHIDREAWKCPLCERNKVISFEAWEDESKLPKGQSVRGEALFCPHCGKPRTPEAWAELEKRMGLA